ncbi:glycosyltransferase family 10 domain-containing protein [Hydrogenovibrio marinus]|uniref:Fucosyltransferase C-terminal domain-containing protein n=1 Tax=Hydrogenovibrio marinus TaxID=28885 RepID=A0A066ZSH6_HYDMR|nr:glycosyltransferase family 10 [Hydrogenovibrio marinus]KDN96748.1 hypothetical protein EI16_10915 [Hydrogenovibrio marinus]BBN58994.1 fucosyltransferase [Hydrogenovibrio marinus]
MIKASIVVPEAYQENKLFDLNNSALNRDNCLYPFHLLKEGFKGKGYDLATSDINEPSSSNIVIYNEMPKHLPMLGEREKSFLLLFESKLIKPDNWDIEKHQFFNKVFTWHDDFVDNEKYFKITFPMCFPEKISKELSKKEKLCTLIAGNKTVSHPLELYSKRVEAIRWFENHHIDQFDLYGIGWDSCHFKGPKLFRALNRIKFLSKLLAPKFPSYQGKVEKKKNVLEKYKFVICFENAKDIPGYITEKIFDCFIAGSVPIYWGASNVNSYIPSGCYVDMKNFSSYEELYQFISKMPDNEYSHYLDEIESFLLSKGADVFSAEHFVRTVISQTVS